MGTAHLRHALVQRALHAVVNPLRTRVNEVHDACGGWGCWSRRYVCAHAAQAARRRAVAPCQGLAPPRPTPHSPAPVTLFHPPGAHPARQRTSCRGSGCGTKARDPARGACGPWVCVKGRRVSGGGGRVEGRGGGQGAAKPKLRVPPAVHAAPVEGGRGSRVCFEPQLAEARRRRRERRASHPPAGQQLRNPPPAHLSGMSASRSSGAR